MTHAEHVVAVPEQAEHAALQEVAQLLSLNKNAPTHAVQVEALVHAQFVPGTHAAAAGVVVLAVQVVISALAV